MQLTICARPVRAWRRWRPLGRWYPRVVLQVQFRLVHGETAGVELPRKRVQEVPLRRLPDLQPRRASHGSRRDGRRRGGATLPPPPPRPPLLVLIQAPQIFPVTCSHQHCGGGS